MNFVKSAKISLIGLKSWLSDKRMIMLALIASVLISGFCIEVNGFARSINSTSNILAVLPTMYTSRFLRLNIQLGIILMFGNAPFHRDDSLYCVTRSGYKSWCAGQLLYIFLSSAIYVAFIFLLTVIFSIPAFGTSLKWNGTFKALGNADDFKYSLSDRSMQLNFTPLESLLNTLALLFLLSVIIGLLMFFLSSTIGRGSGVITATALVLLGMYANYTQYTGYVVKLSPCSLTELKNLSGRAGLPMVSYAYIFLGIFALILTAANLFIYSNKKIRHYVYNTDI